MYKKLKEYVVTGMVLLFVIGILLNVTGCVSRYKPLKKIRPLSDNCEDYILFSDSLTKQRDHGFSKRATVDISGFSVGNEENKELLYQKYKPVIETIYADYRLSVSAVKIFAKVQCEHDLEKNWLLLTNEQYKQVAAVIRSCRLNYKDDNSMEKCLILSAQGKNLKELDEPPEF